MESRDISEEEQFSEDRLAEAQEDDLPNQNRLDTREQKEFFALLARSGPIPDPNTLRQYETIVPGFAKQYLTSFVEESKHRRGMETEIIVLNKQELEQQGWLMRANHQRSLWGLAAGFIISISALGSAVYVTVKGYPWVGGIIGGATVTALAGVFVIGKFQEKQEMDAQLESQESKDKALKSLPDDINT